MVCMTGINVNVLVVLPKLNRVVLVPKPNHAIATVAYEDLTAGSSSKLCYISVCLFFNPYFFGLYC